MYAGRCRGIRAQCVVTIYDLVGNICILSSHDRHVPSIDPLWDFLYGWMQLSDKGTDAFQSFSKNKKYRWEITIQNTGKYRLKFVKQIYKLVQNFSILWEYTAKWRIWSMNSEATNRENAFCASDWTSTNNNEALSLVVVHNTMPTNALTVEQSWIPDT
jgi:hypothetical protein